MEFILIFIYVFFSDSCCNEQRSDFEEEKPILPTTEAEPSPPTATLGISDSVSRSFTVTFFIKSHLQNLHCQISKHNSD